MTYQKSWASDRAHRLLVERAKVALVQRRGRREDLERSHGGLDFSLDRERQRANGRSRPRSTDLPLLAAQAPDDDTGEDQGRDERDDDERDEVERSRNARLGSKPPHHRRQERFESLVDRILLARTLATFCRRARCYARNASARAPHAEILRDRARTAEIADPLRPHRLT